MDASLVIGAHSSFLYESYQSGIPTIQIKDLCFDYDRLKTENIPLKSIDYFKNNSSDFLIKLTNTIKKQNNNISDIVNFISN